MTAQDKHRVWLGIDPGKFGAIAVVDWPDLAIPYRLHNLDDASLFRLVGELRDAYDIRFAFVEEIRPLPFHMRGPIATNKLSTNYGAIKMALTGHDLNFETVEAQVWQRALGCLNRGGNKAISRARANELFPGIKITNEIADSLLLGYYCQQRARHPALLFHKPPARRHSRKSWSIRS